MWPQQFAYMFFSRYLFECLHLLTKSRLLLRLANSGWYMIKYFSKVHKLHFLVFLEYGVALASIFHEMVYSWLLSFKAQRCLLSSVVFFNLAFLKEALWLLYLVLKVFSVRPTYVSLLLLLTTVAWYITADLWHSPLSGHVSLSRQLHGLCGVQVCQEV